MNISPKIKQNLIKIGLWVLFVGIFLFFSCLPAIHYNNISGDKNGRSAVCTIEQKYYSDGSPIDPLTNYKQSSLEEIFFDSTHQNLEKVIVFGKLSYSKTENSFYVRDGAFIIPLDVSGCQHLDQFKNKPETEIVVAGISTMYNGMPLLSVTGLHDSVPGWMKVMANGGMTVIVTLIYFYLIMGIGFAVNYFLIKIGLRKNQESAIVRSLKTPEKKAGWSMMYGIVSIPIWFLNPYAGILVQVYAMYIGYKALASEKKKLALAGIIVSGAGLLIMTFIFLSIGRFSNPPKANFFGGVSTVSDLKATPIGTETLEMDPYLSSKWHFSIHPPKNWVPDDKNPDKGFQLVFRGPEGASTNSKSFSPEIKLGLAPAESLNVSDSGGAMVAMEKLFKTQYKDVKIIDDGTENLLGGHVSSSYIEATYTNDSHILTHTFVVMALRSNLLYMIGADLPDAQWNKYEKVIRDSVSTFDFPQTATTSIQHLVILHTSMGDISFATYDNDAPQTVKNFIKLAQKGFYDDTVFYLAIKGKTIVAGDPTGTGSGGPGYSINRELYADPSYDWGFVGGTLMTIPDGGMMNGSQFMVILDDAPTLAHNYTIFGQVIDGMDVVNAISALPTDKNSHPLNPPIIESVSVKDIQ